MLAGRARKIAHGKGRVKQREGDEDEETRNADANAGPLFSELFSRIDQQAAKGNSKAKQPWPR